TSRGKAMSQHGSASGFTLLEVMIAICILALSVVSLTISQTNSIRASGRAENIQTASTLARQKMTEKKIELQKDIDKESFQDEKANDQGDFEKPFDNYRWEFRVRKVEIPLVDVGGENGGAPPPRVEPGQLQPAATNQVPEGSRRSMAQTVMKKISESVRE